MRLVDWLTDRQLGFSALREQLVTASAKGEQDGE
jgi:hypothetical protein